jgi:phosphopantetheinyl transferase
MAPREFLGMANIAYSAEEGALLASIDDPNDRCSTFYELWTLKEAFGKALQLPLVDALRQCRFVDAGLGRRADVPTNRHWRATVFAPRSQLRLAVARIADATAPLDAPLEMLEWPPPRRCDWTVIRTVAGGGPGERAC